MRRREFRQIIGRETAQIDTKVKLPYIISVVQKRAHRAGIEVRFLKTQGREANRDFRDVINNIKLPLKPSASIRSTVFQGGKVEDARQLLNDGMKYRWKIPIRDLDTGKILEYLQFEPELSKQVPEHEGYIFWTSFQMVLNHFSGGKGDLYHELPYSEEWMNEMWKMSIVHISEPGKERNLTKTSSILAWFLTVASKVSQMVLSFNQDHRAGLVLSAQDWMHQRRVSSESYESAWMYDKSTRKRVKGTWNGFQDWTESTDHMSRQVGAAALIGWFHYIGFPNFYGKFVILTTQQDYTVHEYLTTDWEDGVIQRHYYNGKVTEGFMMSMPLTKTILHLMHDINVGSVDLLLQSLGVRIAPPSRELPIDHERDQHGELSINSSDIV